jgi:hypothetical protein
MLLHGYSLIQYGENSQYFLKNLGNYPGGWYVFATLFNGDLSAEFIYRFLGPTIGFILSIGIFLLYYKPKRNLTTFLIISLLLFPFPGTVAKFLMFLWPFQLVIFFFIVIVELIRSMIIQGYDHVKIWLLGFVFLALFLTHYYYAYLITISLIASLLFTALYSKSIIKIIRPAVYFFTSCITLSFILISLFSNLLSPLSLWQSISKFSRGPTMINHQSIVEYNLLRDILIPSSFIFFNFLICLMLLSIAILVTYYSGAINFREKPNTTYLIFVASLFFIFAAITITGFLEVDSYRGRSIVFIYILFVIVIGHLIFDLNLSRFYRLSSYLIATLVILIPTSIEIKPLDKIVNDYLLSVIQNEKVLIDCSRFLNIDAFSFIDPLTILYPKYCD